MLWKDDQEIEAAVESVRGSASVCGARPGSVDYLKAVARESLRVAGFDPLWFPEHPVLDEAVSAELSVAEGLTVFEIEFIWAICYAMARNTGAWRVALVLPLHHVQSDNHLYVANPHDDDEAVRLSPSTGNGVSIRGHRECDSEYWHDYVSAEKRFSSVFAAALLGVSDRFVGFVETAEELYGVAGSEAIGQARIVDRPIEASYYDPIGELQQTDGIWNAARNHGVRAVDMVVWRCDEVNEKGYDLGFLRGDWEQLSAFDNGGLRTIVQPPEEEKSLLFIWDGSYDGAVEMTCIREDSEDSVAVFPVEIRLRLDYTPSHYLRDSSCISMSTLGALSKKISRGTSLNGKTLNIIGSVHEHRSCASFDPETMTFASEGDFYYVDNASISGHLVSPRLISEIPAGQERYTLLPKDGAVVLMTRNGRSAANYVASRPTLVSNNLFIIWPNYEKAAPEYLACAIRGAIIRGEIKSARASMGKAEVERIAPSRTAPDIRLAGSVPGRPREERRRGWEGDRQ